MKALLIDPTLPQLRPSIRWGPLGLGYLAAVLREAGHGVAVHNRLALQATRKLDLAAVDELTRTQLRELRPDVVGIGGATASYPDMRFLAGLAREELPDALIVIGGPHASVAPRETMERIPEADCLVLGEGERRLLAMVEGVPLASVPGIVYRADGAELHENPWQPPDWDLDGLPHPARELLSAGLPADASGHGVRGVHARTVSMLSSRGCPYRCAFCSEPAYTVRGVRSHSPEYTVEEAEAVLAADPRDWVVFLDEMFTADRERVLELCDLWQAKELSDKVAVCIQSRADHLDDEVLASLRSANCRQIEMGVESGSDAILERMNKGLTVEQNRQAIAATRKAGMRVQANIIVGTPDETEEEFVASMRLIEETQPDVVSLTPFVPLPSTTFVRRLIADGRLERDFWAVEDRTQAPPKRNFTAMDTGRFDELYAKAKQRVHEINSASWMSTAPWWRRARRRVGTGLRRFGLRGRRT